MASNAAAAPPGLSGATVGVMGTRPSRAYPRLIYIVGGIIALLALVLGIWAWWPKSDPPAAGTHQTGVNGASNPSLTTADVTVSVDLICDTTEKSISLPAGLVSPPIRTTTSGKMTISVPHHGDISVCDAQTGGTCYDILDPAFASASANYWYVKSLADHDVRVTFACH